MANAGETRSDARMASEGPRATEKSQLGGLSYGEQSRPGGLSYPVNIEIGGPVVLATLDDKSGKPTGDEDTPNPDKNQRPHYLFADG